MIPVIDVQHALIDRHHVVLEELHLISERVDNESWCLVGGMMVFLLGIQHDRTALRASTTKDADLCVDV
jgi:hypothetical protein